MNSWLRLFCLVLFFSSLVQAQNGSTREEKKTLHSQILNEDREVLVHLPKTYQDQKIKPAHYPVIFLLDAEINYEYFAPMTDFLSRYPYADMPECIVIGLKNTDRTKNFTPTKSSKKNPNKPSEILFENSGGSDDFLRFLQEELKPFLKNNYRISDFSILVGHSFGGLFAIDSFLKNPTAFTAYVANDPSLWWDQNVTLKNAKTYFSKNKNLPKGVQLYISQAFGGDHKNGFSSDGVDAIEEFKKIVEKQASNSFKYQYFKDETHGTVSYPANYEAMKFIFSGFKTDIKELAKQPEKLMESYQEFSLKTNTKFLPAENYLQTIIQFMKTNGHTSSEAYFSNLKSQLYPQ